MHFAIFLVLALEHDLDIIPLVHPDEVPDFALQELLEIVLDFVEDFRQLGLADCVQRVQSFGGHEVSGHL